jgi:hypothetical protein
VFEREDVMRFRRELNALIVKAGADAPEAFAVAVELVDQARAGLAIAAARLRAGDERVPGHSWADLAEPLGVRRQTAAERFGRLPAHAGCTWCGDVAVPRVDCPAAGVLTPRNVRQDVPTEQGE